tara:strand:- start:1808 stop:2179 length:372 start_codon:yes stop_codon:yes gene_type:complete
MTLRKLNLERFATSKSRLGYFGFGVKIKREKFIYFRSNPSMRKSIETWKNNFYRAYRLKSGNYALLSIEGISVFDSSFDREKRRDIFLNRNSEKYQKLRRLSKNRNSEDFEDYLREIIGEHKL